jgi:hypothetical protein
LQFGAVGGEGNPHFIWWAFTWWWLLCCRFPRLWYFPDDDGAASQADQHKDRDNGEYQAQ